MYNISSKYVLCFGQLDSLRKSNAYLRLDTPLELPMLVVANNLKDKYGALRLSKMSVLVNAAVHIDCEPQPLPTIYLLGPDLLGEKEASVRHGIFIRFPQWGVADDYYQVSENYGLNKARMANLLSRYERYPWLQDMLLQLDQLSLDEIIRLAYDFVFDRHTPDGSKRTIGPEAFSRIAVNTILRNFMRANANHLITDGLRCFSEDTVTILKDENSLNEGEFTNDDCFKIGPSNNLLTYHAIYFLNQKGWKASISSLSCLLSCRYLRLVTRIEAEKRASRKLGSSDQRLSKKAEIDSQLEEKEILQKSTFKFVKRSVESLIEQDAVVDLGGRYLALGGNIQTRYGDIRIDPHQYDQLYSKVLNQIRQIDQITKQRAAPSESNSRYQTVLPSPKSPKRPVVYIASTCHNFIDLREEVAQALRAWGYRPILNGDSDYPVEDGVDSYNACVDAVKKSNCLVLIIGNRYGGEVVGKNISITELEYQTACAIGIPRINFCLDTVWGLVQLRKVNPNLVYPQYFTEERSKIDGIFAFLDRVRKWEEGKIDNWVHVFRNSVELKEILRKRLQRIIPTQVI